MPATHPADPHDNLLLETLAAGERDVLLANVTERRYRVGQTIAEPGDPLTTVIFPVGAVFSILAESSEGMSVEAGMVGRDGMVGGPRFLGIDAVPMRTVAQVEGAGLAGDAVTLLALADVPGLAAVARRYAQVLSNHAAQSALCNRVHALEQRAARWLLATADRAGQPTFRLTHDFFASMLGAHRPNVSLAASTLANAGLIQYRRGELEILDRPGLTMAACDCYEITRRDYETVMGIGFGT